MITPTDADMLAALNAYGIQGDDARTSLTALKHQVAQGAPAPWDPQLLVRSDKLTATFADWYGHDASRAATVLYHAR